MSAYPTPAEILRALQLSVSPGKTANSLHAKRVAKDLRIPLRTVYDALQERHRGAAEFLLPTNPPVLCSQCGEEMSKAKDGYYCFDCRRGVRA